MHLRNRFQNAIVTAANTPGLHNNRISAHTLRNRLRENGLHARCPYVGCVLMQRHRQNRLNWAYVHTRWIRRCWNTVIFSDESRFSLHCDDGRVCMYRRRNECYADCCVLERDRFRGGVLSWSGQPLPMVIIHH